MYKHAVFISYKWNGEYEDWVNKIFYPIVRDFFYGQFGKNLAFKDTEQQRDHYGESVIDFLKTGLLHSKCMIAVLNGPYFCSSFWCPKEFAVMLHRNKQYKDQHIKSLLFPVIFTKASINGNQNSLKEICPKLASFIEDAFMPLFLEEEKYLFVNESFKQSNDYNVLKTKIRTFLANSVIPALQLAPAWQEIWSNPEWWDEPYNTFSEQIDCIDFYKQPLMS
jgi:hypothetical protein